MSLGNQGAERVIRQSRALCEEGRYKDAAKLLEKHRLHSHAAAAWRLAGDPRRAGAALERSGDLKAALKIYDKAGLERPAASIQGRLAAVDGNHYEAARYFSRAGQYDEALEHAELANRPDATASIWEAKGDHRKAAKLWLKLGEIERAAKQFGKADDHKRAAACWQKAGNDVESGHSIARAGYPYEAGTIMQKSGELRLAAEYYGKVSGISPHFVKASCRRADVLTRLGEAVQANAALDAGLAAATPDEQNATYFERWARSLYERGEATRARRAMRKLLNAGFGNPKRQAFMEEVEALVNQTASTLGRGAEDGAANRKARFSRVKADSAGLDRRAGERRYAIKGLLGKGGMGEVYEAYDRLLGIPVALKRITEGAVPDEHRKSVLLDEARMACRLDHPNIMKVYDIETEPVVQVAMELIRGESLRDILDARHGRIAWADALRYTEALCNALDYAHAAEIVHRDIKPDNVMVTQDGSIKLLDFGIAHALDKGNENVFVAGTPYYMAPEQCTPGSHIDGRADVYAVGCMLFEFVVGLPPFVDGDILAQHRNTPIPDVHRINGQAYPGIGKILKWALAKNPDKRPRRAGELWKAIDALP